MRCGVGRKSTMTTAAAGKSVWPFLVAILVSSSGILFGAFEPVTTDEKDYSKEVVPVEKNWCETPSLWEVRIGLPGWLAGISGDSGVKGLEASSDVKFRAVA